MPIELTTPFNPGDLDPGKSYTHVEIVHVDQNEELQILKLTVKRGYLDSGAFVVGAAASKAIFVIQDEPALDPPGTEYTSLMADTVASGDVGKSKHQVNAELFYGWLIAEGHYPGTIV